ncbi:MAG TPA: FtsX-like permease family protein, partial [Chitinophagaceae bacterium]|nr:FtsX-like permease family protein [Chitinophagaceae bacterium]
MESWQWQQFYTYVKLKKGSDPIALQNKFREYVKAKVHPITKESGFTYMPMIQPLEKIHLYSSNFIYDNAIRGNITYVKALSIIAIFILLIACFNFINLATAKSMQRAKEVGVRKAIGAGRKQLMVQFTGETIILSVISIIISTALVFLILPALNKLTGKAMTLDIFTNPLLIVYFLLGALAVGILAGFYPALILSGFKPIKVLKGATSSEGTGGSAQWLRKGLVVVQFALSALLIVSAIIVFRQVNYLHNKDLGFNKEEIMFFPMRGDNMFQHYETFKNELKNSPGISSVSIGYGFPGDIFAGDNIILPKNGENVQVPATQLMVDHDYVKTLNLHIIAGRDFSKDIATDKDEAFIINETAVKELGFKTPEKAIGEKLLWHPWEAQREDSMKIGRVIGVVKDFNYKSLYDKMEVTVLQIYPPANWKVAVKIKSSDINKEIAHVKNVWTKFTPDYPIEYKFMDDNFQAMYKSEEKLMTLLWIFTGIAIFIGCLGLFGLAAYAAERRTKEIGIRKVLGASVNGIVLLLSKDFMKLVFVALVIASPIAWYFMNKWLQDFAFRINISWWMFALAAAIALLIALVTVSFQAIKAAIMNPVKSLRTE